MAVELESTLTDRYQTTLPAAVRRALKPGKRDKICYVVRPDGSVVMTRSVTPPEDDPVLGKFLTFLASGMEREPGRVRNLDARFAKRVSALVKGVKVDLDARLAPGNK